MTCGDGEYVRLMENYPLVTGGWALGRAGGSCMKTRAGLADGKDRKVLQLHCAGHHAMLSQVLRHCCCPLLQMCSWGWTASTSG